jgi:Xaa-Pro dipeptidase
MEEHEPVYIFAENTTDLKPGMVYTVEPGIYIQGSFGVRIEDDIVVTPDGCRSLSNLSRELVVIN